MTVKELIATLQEYIDDERIVYIPTLKGECQPVHEVSELKHVGLPDGISIPNDVVLLPIDHDDVQSNEEVE